MEKSFSVYKTKYTYMDYNRFKTRANPIPPETDERESQLRLFDRDNPDINLFNSIDDELIALAGSEILVYKYEVDMAFDDLYGENRQKAINPVPVLVNGHYDPKPFEENLGEFGLELVNDQIFTFNKAYIETKLGRKLISGDIIMPRFQGSYFEITEVQEDSFANYGVYHLVATCKVLRDTKGLLPDSAGTTEAVLGQTVADGDTTIDYQGSRGNRPAGYPWDPNVGMFWDTKLRGIYLEWGGTLLANMLELSNQNNANGAKLLIKYPAWAKWQDRHDEVILMLGPLIESAISLGFQPVIRFNPFGEGDGPKEIKGNLLNGVDLIKHLGISVVNPATGKSLASFWKTWKDFDQGRLIWAFANKNGNSWPQLEADKDWEEFVQVETNFFKFAAANGWKRFALTDDSGPVALSKWVRARRDSMIAVDTRIWDYVEYLGYHEYDLANGFPVKMLWLKEALKAWGIDKPLVGEERAPNFTPGRLGKQERRARRYALKTSSDVGKILRWSIQSHKFHKVPFVGFDLPMFWGEDPTPWGIIFMEEATAKPYDKETLYESPTNEQVKESLTRLNEGVTTPYGLVSLSPTYQEQLQKTAANVQGITSRFLPEAGVLKAVANVMRGQLYDI